LQTEPFLKPGWLLNKSNVFFYSCQQPVFKRFSRFIVWILSCQTVFEQLLFSINSEKFLQIRAAPKHQFFGTAPLDPAGQPGFRPVVPQRLYSFALV
jgi:hypothetical protein